NEPAYLLRCLVYWQQGRTDGAIADCSRLLELNPRNPLAYFVRSQLRAGKDDNEGSEADLAEARELAPELTEALLACAESGEMRRLTPKLMRAIREASLLVTPPPPKPPE